MKFQQKVVGLLYNPPNGKITFGYKNSYGYMMVNIHDKIFLSHRLVAQVYIHNDDKDNKTIVNHIDEKKENNSIENLHWCTQAENVQHSKKTRKVQCEYYNEILTFESCSEVVNWIIENTTQKNTKERPIRKSCSSEFKRAYGIKFWYFEQ